MFLLHAGAEELHTGLEFDKPDRVQTRSVHCRLVDLLAEACK